MKQLSTLDSAFLFLETRKAPMHIGALHIFSAPDKTSASFEFFQQRVEERLQLTPVLKQKVLPIPFNLDSPYLVDDPDFSLSLHLSHIGLPEPNDRNALNELVAAIQRKPLDRDKALWELVFVDNLQHMDLPGRYNFAVISKLHHAIVDNMDGEELLSKLLDFSPTPHPAPKKSISIPEKPPTTFNLLFKTYTSALRSPKKMIQMVAHASKAGASILARKTAGDLKTMLSFHRAPATLFERDLSDDRIFSNMKIPLAQLKHCRTLCPTASLHDIVLGIIASGLHDFLKDENALPADNLIGLVPISVRAPKQSSVNDGQHTNSISAILVDLATTTLSTLDRIAAIRQSTQAAIRLDRSGAMTQLTEFIPSVYLSIAAKLYTRWHLSSYHNPLFNLVITNVPGPQIPLYLGKAKLVEQYGSAPIFHGMGLSIVVLSYNGDLSISINSCSSILKAPEHLIAAMQNNLQTLLAQAEPYLVSAKKPNRRQDKKTLSDADSAKQPAKKSEKT